MEDSLEQLHKTIVSCRTCPRLVAWREKIAHEKRACFSGDTYWGKPVPGFGDEQAEILIVGLAPAAHGANRTGRMFTGDRSGEWLYRALFDAGLSTLPESRSRDDKLRLHNVYITAMVHCAPPQNKPTTDERDACERYFIEELQILANVKVIIALGRFAWDGVLRTLSSMGEKFKPKPSFSHGATATIGRFELVGSFHPSQQNTFTGKLTKPMFDAVFKAAQDCL